MDSRVASILVSSSSCEPPSALLTSSVCLRVPLRPIFEIATATRGEEFDDGAADVVDDEVETAVTGRCLGQITLLLKNSRDLRGSAKPLTIILDGFEDCVRTFQRCFRKLRAFRQLLLGFTSALNSTGKGLEEGKQDRRKGLLVACVSSRSRLEEPSEDIISLFDHFIDTDCRGSEGKIVEARDSLSEFNASNAGFPWSPPPALSSAAFFVEAGDFIASNGSDVNKSTRLCKQRELVPRPVFGVRPFLTSRSFACVADSESKNLFARGLSLPPAILSSFDESKGGQRAAIVEELARLIMGPENFGNLARGSTDASANRRPDIFILVGPPASGKTSVIRQALAMALSFSSVAATGISVTSISLGDVLKSGMGETESELAVLLRLSPSFKPDGNGGFPALRTVYANAGPHIRVFVIDGDARLLLGGGSALSSRLGGRNSDDTTRAFLGLNAIFKRFFDGGAFASGSPAATTESVADRTVVIIASLSLSELDLSLLRMTADGNEIQEEGTTNEVQGRRRLVVRSLG